MVELHLNLIHHFEQHLGGDGLAMTMESVSSFVTALGHLLIKGTRELCASSFRYLIQLLFEIGANQSWDLID
jgi:hypothetical protein